MPPIDTDDTPPVGTIVPADELPTEPSLPAARIRCPQCSGDGYELTIVEKNPDGTFAKGLATACILCRSERTVSKKVFAAWRAHRMGRPSTGKR